MVFDQAKHKGVRPVYVAFALAIFGIVAMLLVDHGPWARPHAQVAEVATYHTTGEAARAAGAVIEPTLPDSPLEPDRPMPKPIDPPNPKSE
jgi:hypothetical protein